MEEGADPAEVTKQIVEMPNYFDEYDVTVNFISQEELDRRPCRAGLTAVWLPYCKSAGDRTARSRFA